MKYTRLTKRIADGEEAFLFHSSLHEGIERLAELEDKIERLELISTKETGDTEIEFFVKHAAAAGIGDVSELKKHRVVVEKSLIPEDDNAYILPNIPPTVKQLYSGEEVEQIVKEREEYKHRAEVAERALKLACYDKARTYFPNVPNEEYENRRDKYYREYVEKSEKELAREGEND